jgi:O-antigen/teichoic acid export membrane protein
VRRKPEIGRTQAAIVQMLGARAVSILATLVGIAMLGRLLPPETFGHYVLALAIYAVMQTLVEFGLRQYLIRSRDEIDAATVSAAVRLSFAIALVCAALCVGTRALPDGIMAPEVRDALTVFAAALLVGPAILSREVRLHRALSFRVPAFAGVMSTVVEVATGIGLALAGFGVVALASGTFAGFLAKAAILFALVPSAPAERPQPTPPMAGLLRFGREMTLVSLLPKVADLALIAMLSGIAGAATVGLYNRAMTVRQVLDKTLLEGVSPVILPTISNALRGGMSPGRVLAVKHDYLTVVIWPAFAMIALLAEPLVRVLLGPNWDAAVPAVRILAIAGVALPATKMAMKFFVAIDRLPVYLRIQSIFLTLRLSLGAVGALVSLEAFCAALVVGICIKAAMIVGWCNRHLDSEPGLHRKAMGRGGVATLAAAAPAAAIMALGLGALPTLVLALAAAGLGWAGALRITGHPLWGDIVGVLGRLPRPA